MDVTCHAKIFATDPEFTHPANNDFSGARQLTKEEFQKLDWAVKTATERVISRGADDVFRPPLFSRSIESALIDQFPDEFRTACYQQTLHFLKRSNLLLASIGTSKRSIVAKDEHTFRPVVWLDPFDAVKYLAVSLLAFETIEAHRIPKQDGVVHSHRRSDSPGEVFDVAFGYDSFRAKSHELSKRNIGGWKIVTDISNFFDRIGNHSLENHLLDIGVEKHISSLLREILLFWSGDRRSFGIPVGSDASRILSEAILIDIDRKMLDAGINFVRYVDDYRIFCGTRVEAAKALELLTSFLSEEGLSLNSKKTSINLVTDSKDVIDIANLFQGGEHEAIDTTTKVIVQKIVQVSGRSAISKFYKEPGKDAIKNIAKIGKEEILRRIDGGDGQDFEEVIKLGVKFFVYVDQDVEILSHLLARRLTSIFYISDALIKEVGNFSEQKCNEIKKVVLGDLDWSACAYPLQVPVLRLAAHSSFQESRYVKAIVDQHRQSDCLMFFREAVSLGYPCLDRGRVRRLAIDVYDNVPDFVRRAIFKAVSDHPTLSDDEKRPLLKNMRQRGADWFIDRM